MTARIEACVSTGTNRVLPVVPCTTIAARAMRLVQNVLDVNIDLDSADMISSLLSSQLTFERPVGYPFILVQTSQKAMDIFANVIPEL